MVASDDTEAFALTSLSLVSFNCSFSRLSPVAGAELPKSRPVPGVFGVLAEVPKDANAPDPRPKADEAPLVGEATLVVVKGVMPLSGLVLLLKESKRLAGWYVLNPPFLPSSVLPLLLLESESLLEL